MKRQPEQAEISVKSKRKSPTKKQGQFSSTKKKKILSFRDVHYTLVFYLIRNCCCLSNILQVNHWWFFIKKSNVIVFLLSRPTCSKTETFRGSTSLLPLVRQTILLRRAVSDSPQKRPQRWRSNRQEKKIKNTFFCSPF
jgi:hypothetical protein